MSAGEVRSKQRAWLCCGFLVEYDDDATEAELFVTGDERPVVIMPAHWDAEQRDYACGWAIADLFEQRYGWLAMVRGITTWDEIVAGMGAQEEAAD